MPKKTIQPSSSFFSLFTPYNAYHCFLIILLVFILRLQYDFWFGQYNIFQYHQQIQKLNQLKTENTIHQERNDLKYHQIIALRDNHQLIETLAREKFAYTKPGELFFQYQTKKTSENTTT